MLPPPPPRMPWLFVKGMGAPALADQQIIRSAFEQWGAREIRVPKDPVTGKTRGIAIIRLQDPYQVPPCSRSLCNVVDASSSGCNGWDVWVPKPMLRVSLGGPLLLEDFYEAGWLFVCKKRAVWSVPGMKGR